MASGVIGLFSPLPQPPVGATASMIFRVMVHISRLRRLLDQAKGAGGGGSMFALAPKREEAERLCDRIAIMHRGKILDTGTLEELRARHQEDDFEELFFGLLSQHEARPAAPGCYGEDDVVSQGAGI